MPQTRQVLVTGGAGYVGAVLVSKLLQRGYRVRVLDLYLYGTDVLAAVQHHPNLEQIKGDLRDPAVVTEAVAGCQAVIHLACISNDPSFELDPALGKSINYDAFLPLVRSAKRAGVRRFVYASSSSVYGVKHEENVTEDLPLEPLTDYSRYKAQCEEILLQERAPGFAVLVLRPATVCGWSPRLRLDLSVNILAHHALRRRKITVHGGNQKRPNIHIDDVTDLYVNSLEWPEARIDGKTYNAGYDNLTINEIAGLVRAVVGPDVVIERTSTNDHRSYHISSEKIKSELGFAPRRSIRDAVVDLVAAFRTGKVPDPDNARYYNIQTMQQLQMR
jgi:nucleoside-diphosphate-sugar epimerase